MRGGATSPLEARPSVVRSDGFAKGTATARRIAATFGTV